MIRVGFGMIRKKISIWQNWKNDILSKLLLINGCFNKNNNIKRVEFSGFWINLQGIWLVDKLSKRREILFKAFIIIRLNLQINIYL